MSLLKRIFAAVLGLAEEVAAHVVEEVRIAKDATANEAMMDRKEAMDRGQMKLMAFARKERFPYDPHSVNDTFKLLKEKVFPHDWTDQSLDDLKRHLAQEMRIEGYTVNKDNAADNDKLRTELQIMVGYGDIALER